MTDNNMCLSGSVIGLVYTDDKSRTTPITGFTATCRNCGSTDVTLLQDFNYYGGYTGWDLQLIVFCRNCDNRHELEMLTG